MPLLSLGQFLGDEDACCILDHFLVEAARHLPVKRLIAPDISSFEQGRADSEILPGHAPDFVDGAARLPYLQPQIPKRVERLEERSVGKECFRKYRFWWWPEY